METLGRPALTSWRPVPDVRWAASSTTVSPYTRANFDAPLGTAFSVSGVSSTDYRDLQQAASCFVDGIADGWLFVAMPYNGLWAWHPICGTKIELIRDATTSVTSDTNKAAHRRTESMQHHIAAAPQLPLRYSNEGALLLNAVCAVPAAIPEATVLVVSIVNARLHGTYLKCERRGAVSIVRLIDAAFLETRLHGSMSPTPQPLILVELGGPPPDTELDSITISVASGGRSTTRRTSLLLHVRGRRSPGSDRVGGFTALVLDAPARCLTVSAPWVLGYGKVHEITWASWMGDAEHHVACVVGKTDISVYAIQSTDRIGSATISGTFVSETATPITVTTSPIASVHCYTNSDPQTTDSIVGVVASDNSLQLLRWSQTRGLQPLGGLIYQHSADRLDAVRVLDEEYTVSATTEGKILPVANWLPEFGKPHKLHCPGVSSADFDRIKFADVPLEHGIALCQGNVIVFIRTK